MTEIRVFLSSGDDVVKTRDLIWDLVHKSINPALDESGAPFKLYPDRWETSTPEKTRTPATNDKYVAKAMGSHLTIALLLDSLGNGTREEIVGVLHSECKCELSALWLIDRSEHPDNAVSKFLDEVVGETLYRKAGKPGSDECWFAIVNVFTHLISTVLRNPQGYAESR